MLKDDAAFHAQANETISRLAEIIDDDLGDDIDVEIQNDILTLELADGGQYIVNKNAPFHQIWLSSPKSGAWHFDWVGGAWRASKGDKPALLELLAGELQAVTGRPVRL